VSFLVTFLDKQKSKESIFTAITQKFQSVMQTAGVLLIPAGLYPARQV
jgi:hypothetical protein